MLSRLLLFFIAIFFKLPLFILHLLGGLFGRIAYQFDRRFKDRIDINLIFPCILQRFCERY